MPPLYLMINPQLILISLGEFNFSTTVGDAVAPETAPIAKTIAPPKAICFRVRLFWLNISLSTQLYPYKF